MSQLIELDGEVVAIVGATRAHLAPAVEGLPERDDRRRFVELMCEYALRMRADGQPYVHADALFYARMCLERLLP